MNRIVRGLRAIGMGLLVLVLSTSCNDELSQIGESIQAENDKVYSYKHFLQFEASTVQSPRLYSGLSTAGLIGTLSDPTYGDFSADFVAQVRSARGFKFSHTPINGEVDSVELRLLLNGHTGLISSPLLLSVYEAPLGFEGDNYSESSLRKYADASRLLGESTVSLDKSVRSWVSGADTITYLPIKLDKALGQRIYDMSLNASDAFDSQASFSSRVLGGLYVTPSTGSGAVFGVGSIALILHYNYLDAKGKSTKTSEMFINTKLTAHANGLTNTYIDDLLAPSDKYTYVKGPAGVQTEVVLPAAQMKRLLDSRDASTAVGRTWMLSDAQLSLSVDNPTDLLLNPPTYMMLMPVDSIAGFFSRGQTERSAAATSYLSSAYDVTKKVYNFSNIARLLTRHLSDHATYNAGSWTVDKDLRMRVLPVRRTTTRTGSSSSSVVTVAIDEYLYPSFVRLDKSSDKLRIGIVSTEFKQ